MDDLRLHGLISGGIKRNGDNQALSSEVSGNTLKLTPPKGSYDGELSKVTITEVDFIKENIKNNVNLWGVIGTLEEKTPINYNDTDYSATINGGVPYTTDGPNTNQSGYINLSTADLSLILFNGNLFASAQERSGYCDVEGETNLTVTLSINFVASGSTHVLASAIVKKIGSIMNYSAGNVAIVKGSGGAYIITDGAAPIFLNGASMAMGVRIYYKVQRTTGCTTAYGAGANGAVKGWK